MNTRQADQIIKAGTPVTVHNSRYNETFSAIFVSRDRYSIYSSDGGCYDRADLEIVQSDDTPEEDQLMTIEIRFYHSGDYQNNRSEEYLRNGAFHGEYSTMFDAINELHRLDAYNLSVRQVGRFEYSENGQVSGWTYSSSTLTWGMRYWIVESDDTPEPKDLSQNALDYTLSYVECSACGHNSLKSRYVEDGRGFCVLCGGTIVGKFEKGTIEAEEIN